jgi:hypothetical protein
MRDEPFTHHVSFYRELTRADAGPTRPTAALKFSISNPKSNRRSLERSQLCFQFRAPIRGRLAAFGQHLLEARTRTLAQFNAGRRRQQQRRYRSHNRSAHRARDKTNQSFHDRLL